MAVAQRMYARALFEAAREADRLETVASDLAAPAGAVDDAPITAYDLNSNTGVIHKKWDQTIFPKGHNHIKVTYTVGYSTLPADLSSAIAFLSCASLLSDYAGQNGGLTSRSIVAYSESYGNGGKYSDKRKQYIGQAMALLNKYKSGLVG